MASTVLGPLNSLKAFAHNVGLRHREAASHYMATGALLLYFVLCFPEFDYSIICRQNLNAWRWCITEWRFLSLKEFHSVDLLIEFYWLQAIEFGLVRLNLCQVFVVKVSGSWLALGSSLVRLAPPKNDNSAALVSNCKILSWIAKPYSCQDVGLCHMIHVFLTKSCNIDPALRLADNP